MLTPALSPGQPEFVRVITALRRHFDETFPARGLSYYVLGSFAEGAAVPGLSDLDLVVVLRGQSMPGDDQAAAGALAALAAESPLRLDCMVRAESDLGSLYPVFQRSLKSASQLIAGEDIRPRLPEISLDDYRRSAWEGAIYFMGRHLRQIDGLPWPLDYPDPAGEFFGYERVRAADWYPPGTTQGTKELGATVSRLCGALLADRAGIQVAGKIEALQRYPLEFQDRHAPLVQAMLADCKLRWQYRVPDDAAERARLRDFCRQALDFEKATCARLVLALQAWAAGENEALRGYARARLEQLPAGATLANPVN